MGKKNNDTKDTIISFAYVDCSIFAVECSAVKARSQSIDGIIFEISVTISKCLLEKEEILLNEPVYIDIDRLACYGVVCCVESGLLSVCVSVYLSVYVTICLISLFVHPSEFLSVNYKKIVLPIDY